ncbi:AraC family transcriptional regulator, partial [Micromonospora sp. AMSO31t]
ELAVRFGYYDQSHLIREFREFAGATPAALAGSHSSNPA